MTRIKTVVTTAVCKEKFRGTTMGSNSGKATTAPHVYKHVKERESARERERARERESKHEVPPAVLHILVIVYTHTNTQACAQTHMRMRTSRQVTQISVITRVLHDNTS